MRLYRFVSDRFLLLPLGAVIALIWANIAAESYFRFAHGLAFVVNEIAMGLFLALIAQEILEALMPGGALHTWRRWALPAIAGMGGAMTAAFTYLTYIHAKNELMLAPGWPIGCVVDIAAGYYVLKMIYRRHAVLSFFLLLAVVTNTLGFVVMAVWPSFVEGRLPGALLVMTALGVAATLRRRNVRTFWPYLALPGTLSWLGFYWAGVHPALALIPIVPFLPHEPRTLDLLADVPDDDAIHHVEHRWNELAQIALFLFGLVNAGVVFRGHGTGTWAVLTASLAGRPLGILAAVAIALTLGLQLPRRVGWRDLVVIALATSSGFTFALFFATGLVAPGPLLGEIKLGALSTVLGAVVAMVTAHALRVGRFAR
jgi:NhaA family Na+:H+ antiporter